MSILDRAIEDLTKEELRQEDLKKEVGEKIEKIISYMAASNVKHLRIKVWRFFLIFPYRKTYILRIKNAELEIIDPYSNFELYGSGGRRVWNYSKEAIKLINKILK